MSSVGLQVRIIHLALAYRRELILKTALIFLSLLGILGILGILGMAPVLYFLFEIYTLI